jgi:hypothetical protein
MDKAAHLADCDSLWENAKGMLAKQRGLSWDPFARESFELVRVVLLYQRNALELYEETVLHGRLRNRAAAVTPAPWIGDALFSVPGASNTVLAGIFVASASFRLPVAVLKAVELSAEPFEERKLIKRDSDWNRDILRGAFKKVKALKCCNDSSLGADTGARLLHAITIAVVHRDDFGHGEVGQPTVGEFRRERGDVLDELHICRILEAQRELCRWTLTRLSEKR